jgi:hypothetical protein
MYPYMPSEQIAFIKGNIFHKSWAFSLFCFLVVLGVWAQGLKPELARQALCHLSQAPSPFAFILFFSDRLQLLLVAGLDLDAATSASQVAGIQECTTVPGLLQELF